MNGVPSEKGPKALEQFDISGRSAFVTGAASGIGLAYAEAMAEAGAKVTLSDIDGAAAEREAARLRSEGYEARGVQLDVTDRARTTQIMDEHAATYGGLDICFANAGLGLGPGFWSPAGGRDPAGQIDTFDPAMWDKTIAINLTGAYNTMRDAARIMKKQGPRNGRLGGSIIATASNAGIMCEAIVPMPYMPSKAGVIHMVKHMAFELGEYKIRVNAILPGPFVTNIADGYLKDPVVRKAWDESTLMGRIADTWQIKPLALFLASDASSYVTGSPMLIDGGMALGKLG